MSEARIVRVATEPDDVHEAPAGMLLIAMDGTVLRRQADVRCKQPPYWFDTCPGCHEWVVLTDDEQRRTYATDQLFAEWGDRLLGRAVCDHPASHELSGPFHPTYRRAHISGPYLIHTPVISTAAQYGESA